MIDSKIIDLVVSKTKITERKLIEKDLILHRLLMELELDKYFSDNFAFKGGTCLIKCFIDYYRFSEDLDFTFLNQSLVLNKTKTQTAKILSSEITKVAEILKKITDKIGLDFKLDKQDRKYFEYGGSNRFVTYKLWYKTEKEEETFVKVQINFIEKLEFPVDKKQINNIFFSQDTTSKSAFLLPMDSEWALKVPILKCYDIREILVEKARAILTRRGTKARDYIDIYMIEKTNKLNIQDYKKQIIDKISAMMKFEKYKNAIEAKENFILARGTEEGIMLQPIPDNFDQFLERLNRFLKEVVKEINFESVGKKAR